MAVCLSGLPGYPAFDAVGESATLAQRRLTWKEEFELYVTASGISDPTQKKSYFFTSAGPKSEMFSIIRFLSKHEAKRKITKKLWTASRNTKSSKRLL